MFKKLVLFIFLLNSVPTKAKQGINTHYFTPTANTEFSVVETAQLYSPFFPKQSIKSGLFSLSYDYVDSPLVQNNINGERELSLVEHIHTLQTNLAYTINDNQFLFVGIPIHITSLNSSLGQTTRSTDLGEGRFFMKFVLENEAEDNQNFQLALIPEIRLPLSDKSSDRLVSSGGPTLSLKLAGDKLLKTDLFLGFHIGAEFAPESKFRNIDYSYMLPIGLGLSKQLSSKWKLTAETSSAVSFSGSSTQNIFQMLFGPNYLYNNDTQFIAQIGSGKISSDSALDYRFVIGIKTPFEISEKIVSKSSLTRKTVKNLKNELSGEISFLNNSSHLDSTAKNYLFRLSHQLKKTNFEYKVEIEGYSSNIGDSTYNIKLSEQRAQTVKKYLIYLGIPEQLINTSAFGAIERSDINSNNTDEKQLLNRHAKIYIK